MPALLEAHKLSTKALPRPALTGRTWIFSFYKLDAEETKELRTELSQYPAPGPRPHPRGIAGSGRPPIPAELQERFEEEIGDLFFVVVNMARYLSLDSESALKKSNRKFKRRFQWIEQQLNSSGRCPQDATEEELDSLWRQAKEQEQIKR